MRLALILLCAASIGGFAEESVKPVKPLPKKASPVQPSGKARQGEANPRPWCGKTPAKAAPKKSPEMNAPAPNSR